MGTLNYKISFAQRRLWLIDQFENAGSAYNISFHYHLENLKLDLVEKTFHYLIERHEILRTTFDEINGEPRQVVHEAGKNNFKVNYLDISLQPDAMQKALEIKNKETAHQFDLVEGPLLRVTFIKIDDNSYGIIVVLHHIIFDGWSMDILLDELEQVYAAYDVGVMPNLEPLNFQYKDYTLHQYEQFEQGKFEKAKLYWHKLLGQQVLQKLSLLPNTEHISSKNFVGKTAQLKVNRHEYKELKTYCIKNKSTLIISLMTALKVVFYRYTGFKDLIVGTVVSGREWLQLENQLGFYVNTVPIRTRISEEDISFQELFELIKDNILSAYQYQDYPFDVLVDDLNLKDNRKSNPIFDILVTMNMGDKSATEVLIDDQNNETEIRITDNAVCKFDMTATFVENENDLYLNLNYDPQIYPDDFIIQMLGHFQNCVSEFIKDPFQKINSFDMLHSGSVIEKQVTQKKEIPDEGNSLIERFVRICQEYPEAIASIDCEDEISYNLLNKRADILANILIKNYNFTPGSVLAIHCNQSISYLVYMLATLKAGGIFMPIDKDTPRKRLEYMVNKVNAALLISDKIDENIDTNTFIVQSQFLKTSISNVVHSPTKPVMVKAPSHMCYIIFTSGSTGYPKGVICGEKSLINLSYWYMDLLKITNQTKSTMFTSISFDAHILELWPVLLSGGTTFILSDELKSNPKKLSRYSIINKIDQMFLPTAFYHQFREEKLISDDGIIITGGEKLWHRGNGNWKLLNMYGPTEATVVTTWSEVPKGSKRYPIGKPIWNTEVYVLDKHGNEVPRYALGELYIGGDALAKGYYNDKDLTEKSFVNNPFQGCGKLYKTGDLVYCDENNDINFVKRIDEGQVKLRGYRIELKEVEKVFLSVEGVTQVFVKFVEKAGKAPYIIAFYQGDNDVEGIQKKLYSILPAYMVPSKLVRIEIFPTTINGKIDEAKLLLNLPSTTYDGETITRELPQTETEKYLYNLWCEIFDETESFDINKSFFSVGGNSLSAMKLANRVYRDLDKTILLKEIFNNSTIKEMAQQLDERVSEKKFGNRLQNLSSIDLDLPNLICIPPVLGLSAVFIGLAQELDGKVNMFGFDYPGIQPSDTLPKSVEDIVTIFVNEIISYLKDAPVILMGYSLGATISFHVARKIEEEGMKVSLIFLDKSPEKILPSIDVSNHRSELDAEFQMEYADIKSYFEEDEYEHLLDVFSNNIQLGIDHEDLQGKVKADITAIQAKESVKLFDMMRWEKYTEGFFSYHLVNGKHQQVLSPNNLPLIKRIVYNVMATAVEVD